MGSGEWGRRPSRVGVSTYFTQVFSYYNYGFIVFNRFRLNVMAYETNVCISVLYIITILTEARVPGSLNIHWWTY